jgi:hypothetical protein
VKAHWQAALYGGSVAMLATSAIINSSMLMRAFAVVVLVLLTGVIGYSYGMVRAHADYVRATSWLPDQISWHQDDDGVRHALVTQRSGNVATITIPDEIDTPNEALQFVVRTLAEDE